MSWRVVVISKRCKLDYSMNYMVIRAEDTKRILLDEMAVLIIENNTVSMTGCLLSMLGEKKIKVILCDSKRNPQLDMIPLYGAHNDSKRIREQIMWGDDAKASIWTNIIKEKIRNQAAVLREFEREDEASMLDGYSADVMTGDISNREGHAAKVYFNTLFGMKFSRSDEDNIINAALNYGYSLILSAFNREIVANGYLTQLGVGHENQFNHFNLSCDLMEPFRVLVDVAVKRKDFQVFETEEKHYIAGILNQIVNIRDTGQTLINAIRIYTKSVFDAIEENNPELIRFFDYELSFYENDRVF